MVTRLNCGDYLTMCTNADVHMKWIWYVNYNSIKKLNTQTCMSYE